jgi:hypothetical protein
VGWQEQGWHRGREQVSDADYSCSTVRRSENLIRRPSERQGPHLNKFTVTDGRRLGLYVVILRHFWPLVLPSGLRLRPAVRPGRRRSQDAVKLIQEVAHHAPSGLSTSKLDPLALRVGNDLDVVIGFEGPVDFEINCLCSLGIAATSWLWLAWRTVLPAARTC